LHVGRIASSHASLARRLASELEVPLKGYATSPEFGPLSAYEDNLASLAQSFENTKVKSEKARSKGKAKKQEDAARGEQDARASWETESPLIMEKLQTLDEARMLMLKDIFVKCMMMEVETSQAAMGEAEGIMNSLLSLNPAREVDAFAAQQKDDPTRVRQRRRSSIMTNNQTFTPSPSASPMTRPPPVSTLSIPEDAGSIKSEKRKSRFGTILRSGRNSIRAPNLNLRSFSPEKKRNEKREAERQRGDSTSMPPPMPMPQNITQTPFTQSPQSPPIQPPTQNGTSQNEPLAPVRRSSIANLESQPSPIKEDRPTSSQNEHNEDAERASILSSESNYAPPLRVEIMKDVIPEEPREREQAVNTLQNTLRAQSTISRKTRGRRDGRASMYEPGSNEFGLMSPPIRELGGLTLSPTSAMTAPRLSPVRVDSDTQSLSSVRTAGTTRPSGITLHPDLETPGLNISILETLSAILSEGAVQKTFVTGEIAISNLGARVVGINLFNADNLEQIVTNKAILNDTGNTNYSLTSENLPAKGAVAMKYKVALRDDPQSTVPLLIRTLWKIEQDSVSLMVGYQLNSAFMHGGTLSNIVISTSIPTDPRIVGCQSKPQGQFSRERGQLIWNIASVEAGPEQIVLAKFAVEGLCQRPGNVEAKWECRGITVSGIDVVGVAAKDPFADEQEGIIQANVLRGLVSGKYYCQS
jgi:F-BAR domain only protein